METSCATISPEARGAATAGGPEFGKRARRKNPRRSANRFLLKRALRKAESPLFLVTSPMRERSLCRTGDASVHGRTRRGARRYRAVSVEFLKNRRTAERLVSQLPERAHR